MHQSDSGGTSTGLWRPPPPTAMGFEQLLELEGTSPIAGPGKSEDTALSKQLIEGATIVLKEAAKEAQLSLNEDSPPMTDRIIQKKPTKVAKTDKLYNHHKVLIFACYRLYEYVDCNARKQEKYKLYITHRNHN